MSWKWLWETGKVFACKNNDKNHKMIKLSSVQSLSRVHLFATPWTVACQASLSITNSRSSLKLVHWVGDAIQPSHPLSSPSFLDLSLSQNQGLSQWVSSLHQVAKLLELQHQSFQWCSGLISFRIDWFILQSKGLSRVFSSTTVWKHQFFGAHIGTVLEKP